MKEIEFKLDSKTIKETKKAGLKQTLVFNPSNLDLEKKIKITINKTILDSICDDMGLPDEIDDTVRVNFGIKNKQSKILPDDPETEITINDRIITTQDDMENSIKEVLEKKDQQEKKKTKKKK